MASDLELIFLRLARSDIALVKFLFESYEGVAVVRTLDKRAAVIVVMAARDFSSIAREILASLRETIAIEEVAPPEGLSEDWLLNFVRSEES